MSFASASYIQRVTEPSVIIEVPYNTFAVTTHDQPEIIGEIELEPGSYIITFNYLIYNSGSANITGIIFTFNDVNYVGIDSDAPGSEDGSVIKYWVSLANSCTFFVNIEETLTYQLTATIQFTGGTAGPAIGIGPNDLAGAIKQNNYFNVIKVL